MENYRLIHALRTGAAPDMDVYDAAAWSAVSALSEKSIAGKSIPVEFPDFTRGKWKGKATDRDRCHLKERFHGGRIYQ